MKNTVSVSASAIQPTHIMIEWALTFLSPNLETSQGEGMTFMMITDMMRCNDDGESDVTYYYTPEDQDEVDEIAAQFDEHVCSAPSIVLM